MSSEDAVRNVVEQLGRALVARDFAAAAALTASWLRPRYDEAGWRTLVERELAAMAREWSLTDPPWPVELEVDTNPLTFAGWVETNETAAARGAGRDLPREINASNFRKRMRLALMTAEGSFDFDEWCVFWLAVVEESGVLRIGDVEVKPW